MDQISMSARITLMLGGTWCHLFTAEGTFYYSKLINGFYSIHFLRKFSCHLTSDRQLTVKNNGIFELYQLEVMLFCTDFYKWCVYNSYLLQNIGLIFVVLYYPIIHF